MDAAFTKADLDLLRSPLSGSGFKNVYLAEKSHDGPLRYVAKIKTGGRLRTIAGSRGPEPWRVAHFVLAWYATTFGDDWRGVLRSRKRNAIRVYQLLKTGRYHARVFHKGRPVEVTRKDGRRASWATRAAAAAGARKFAEGLIGGSLRGNCELYRVGVPLCPVS